MLPDINQRHATERVLRSDLRPERREVSFEDPYMQRSTTEVSNKYRSLAPESLPFVSRDKRQDSNEHSQHRSQFPQGFQIVKDEHGNLRYEYEGEDPGAVRGTEHLRKDYFHGDRLMSLPLSHPARQSKGQGFIESHYEALKSYNSHF